MVPQTGWCMENPFWKWMITRATGYLQGNLFLGTSMCENGDDLAASPGNPRLGNRLREPTEPGDLMETVKFMGDIINMDLELIDFCVSA